MRTMNILYSENMDKNITKQVQDCEIDILYQIDKICKKYDLEYFGIGGTALGAVRHEGFIPWDDDIDIGMTRKDYELFLKVAKEELPQQYHVQNFDTEPNSPFYFTKIRKNNTKFVEYYLKDYDIHHGIFVDIFPFDNIPDKAWQERLHFKVSRLLYQLFLCKSLKTICSSRFEQTGAFKKNYKYYVRILVHYLLFPLPKKWLFHAMDKTVQLFNGKETQRMGHIVRKRLAVSKEILYPIRLLKFGEVTMPVPNDYDTYLKRQFGNYMSMPSKEKRYGHLPYKVEV